MNPVCPRIVGLLIVILLAGARPAVAESLEAVEKLAGEWVKLRVETTRLETEWREERELLGSLVGALEQRAARGEEKRDLAQAKSAKDREELAMLRAKHQSATRDAEAFESGLQAIAVRLLALRPGLPPRLSDALEMSYRSLAAHDRTSRDRMQAAMTILNRCAQFNRLVTASEEVLAVAGSSKAALCEVVYWGLSHGYALDRTAKQAWFGSPVDGTWQWEPRPDAFQAVTRLVAIASDRADPDFVAAPAAIKRAIDLDRRSEATP